MRGFSLQVCKSANLWLWENYAKVKIWLGWTKSEVSSLLMQKRKCVRIWQAATLNLRLFTGRKTRDVMIHGGSKLDFSLLCGDYLEQNKRDNKRRGAWEETRHAQGSATVKKPCVYLTCSVYSYILMRFISGDNADFSCSWFSTPLF